MIGHKSSVTVPGSLHVYQGIAFVALLATVYVATPPGLRLKVMAIAAVVAVIVAVAAGYLYRATNRS
jgi:hypothetical protein